MNPPRSENPIRRAARLLEEGDEEAISHMHQAQRLTSVYKKQQLSRSKSERKSFKQSVNIRVMNSTNC